MKSRRQLIDGLKPKPVELIIDPKVEEAFVFKSKKTEPVRDLDATPALSTPVPATPTPPAQHQPRSPISTRIRSDFATALKRASLERQLSGVEPHTLQDILEQAIEPWLKQHGYLP